jgi:hypothetical protein
MYSVLIAILATTAFMGPPSPSSVPAGTEAAAPRPDPMIKSVGERRAVRENTEEDPAAKATRLEKLWIPLPCTRVDKRMVC